MTVSIKNRVIVTILSMIALIITTVDVYANNTQPKFTIIPQASSTVTVATNDTAHIKYIVTNKLPLQETLTMTPVNGITQVTTTGSNACQKPMVLNPGESCTLVLSINGSQFPVNQTTTVNKSPQICIGTSKLSCSQPSTANWLKVTVVNHYAVTVTASGDGNETIQAPTTKTIVEGGAADFIVTAKPGYILSHTVTGTCPVGGTWSGSVYTTPPIPYTCSVKFKATLNTVTVNATGSNITFTGSTSNTIAVNDTTSFTVTANSGYTLSTVTGSCPTDGGTWIGNLYTTPPIPSLPNPCTVIFSSILAPDAVLNLSSPGLVIAQAGIFTAASGAAPGASTPRTLTISNSGTVTAVGLSIVFSPLLSASGASSTNTCGTQLNSQASCTVTIKPGTPSIAGSAPATNTMTVNATNAASPVSAVITTLTYGSVYGGGYVFSINDSTAATQNVGLVEVADVADTPSPSSVVWDPDQMCATIPYQCSFVTNATHLINGKRNTAKIESVFFTNGIMFADSYTAGLCILNSSGGYSDWYLPAICEMGYKGANSTLSICGTLLNPLTQNMQSNLIDFFGSDPTIAMGLYYGGILTTGSYWSSTENLTTPISYANFQTFTQHLGSNQGFAYKYLPSGVRCVRQFYP